MSDLVIDTHSLRKEFGPKVAVADLTLDVRAGEVFGFLGPNGAGKTTSIKMLLSLTKPTAGRATLLGRPLGDLAARAKIGYLPEHFRFHEWLRADEFLNLHGELYGMDRAARGAAVPRLLKLVGLEDRAATKLGAFSKGMLQRIGLAQALLNDPALVFLDEPTSGLDPIGRRVVRDIITDLRQRGMAVFLNSHFLSEVEKTCDRVAFIRGGRVLQTSSLKEFEEEAMQVVVRVGQPTPELLTGLAQFGRNVALEPGDGRVRLTMSDEAQLPALAHWVVQNGHNLYELTPTHLSLEDRFLQVVGEESDE
ncbi:MAG: ABC transporter ATP-binding protein [Candidatus Promineofilum sp.]|jgi:ABC-2 type transport system ATP-binding protein|nr:ABC transporter ATP-binding protein [Promineifilum sp.]